MPIPKEGYFKLEQGRYGPIYPQTPANYGFSVVGKVKPGREQAIRDYGKNIEEAVKGAPDVLASLKLHYLRWILFDIGSGLHFMYQGIFDTDFDKYLEDVLAIFLEKESLLSSPILKAGPRTGRRTPPPSLSTSVNISVQASSNRCVVACR